MDATGGMYVHAGIYIIGVIRFAQVGEAIKDHLMRVMADTIKDKEKAQEIHISRLLKRT